MKIRNQVLRVLLGLALMVTFVLTANTGVRAELKTEEVVSNETVNPNIASGKWGDLKWEVSGTTLTISGKGKMVSKSQHSEYPWAEYDSSVTKIVIGDSVTSIGNHAFNGMKLVKNVEIGSSVIKIGEYAFTATSVKSITIPDSCKKIGGEAFSRSTLESIHLGKGISSIEAKVFWGCYELTTVTMSNKVTSIGESAFASCTSLENFSWPDKLESIGNSAFCWCFSLKEVDLAESVKTIDKYAFESCTSISEIEIGGNVTYIGHAAFRGCTSLTKFTSYSGDIEFGNGYASGEYYPVFDGTSVTIYSWENSLVEQYAKDYRIPFVSIKSLDTPTNKNISNETNGVKVSWNAVRGATTYNVYRATSKDGKYVAVKSKIKGTSYTDTTAKNGKTYYYKVKAINKYGTSELSEAQKITYVAASKITSCTNLSSGIKVEWKKVSGATGYAIYRKTSKGSWARVYTAKSGSTSSWIDKSIKSKNGTTYKYAIRALKGNVLSGCDTTGKTIVRLTNRTLKSVTKASKTSIKCKWTKSSSVTGYQIRVMQNGKVVKTVTVKDKNTATKTITGLKSGKKYQVQVRSYKTVSSKKYYSAWSTKKTVKL